MIELKLCKAEKITDGINLYTKDGTFLGVICGTEPNKDWDLILQGHDPIEEKWEDGSGNTVSLKGWC